jgi:hypothetical protein
MCTWIGNFLDLKLLKGIKIWEQLLSFEFIYFCEISLVKPTSSFTPWGKQKLLPKSYCEVWQTAQFSKSLKFSIKVSIQFFLFGFFVFSRWENVPLYFTHIYHVDLKLSLSNLGLPSFKLLPSTWAPFQSLL